jgi:hypothetical protein
MLYIGWVWYNSDTRVNCCKLHTCVYYILLDTMITSTEQDSSCIQNVHNGDKTVSTCDIQNDLSLEQQEILRFTKLYGVPPNQHSLALKNIYDRDKERKYFDSGDYALSKSAPSIHPSGVKIASVHPSPDRIPRGKRINNNGIGSSAMSRDLDNNSSIDINESSIGSDHRRNSLPILSKKENQNTIYYK